LSFTFRLTQTSLGQCRIRSEAPNEDRNGDWACPAPRVSDRWNIGGMTVGRLR